MQTSSQIAQSEIVVPVEARQTFVNEVTAGNVSVETAPLPRPRILQRRAARWARRVGH
ncbi:MAG: hypothetical protein AAF683_11790 [Pseudomonadota bacterium]